MPTYPLKKLSEICDIINGSTPSRTNKEYWENGTVAWFTIEDVRLQGRRINETRQKITEKALKETSVKLLPVNTILLCCTASIGEYAITKIPVTTNQQFNGLVIKDPSEVNPDYLFHFCATLKDALMKVSGKTTIDFIPISRLKELHIPLPPLSVQEEIVAHLDAVRAETDRLASLYEQKLADLDELRRSVLQEAFAQNT